MYRHHLRAQSTGWTMLVLPLEYSHCLKLQVLSGEEPQLMRTDIALTGILFNQNVDVRLVSRIGLFTHPRCRWKDYKEFESTHPVASNLD